MSASQERLPLGLPWAQHLDRLPAHVSDSPFYRLMGFEIRAVEPGAAEVAMPAKADLLQFQQAVHGGAIFAVADAAVAIALLASCRIGDQVLTVGANLNYLAPITGGASARARIVHQGRSFALGEVEVFRDSDRRLAAKGLMTYTVRAPRS